MSTVHQGRQRAPADEPAHQSPAPAAEVASTASGAVPVAGLAVGLALHRHSAGADPTDPLGGTPIPVGIAAILRRRAGTGEPLPEEFGRAGSAALGRDLSQVRLHTGPDAAGLARSVQAHAFTYGQDIYFAQGAYRPSEPGGQRLLAHELGHIGQDSAGSGQIGRADDPAEAAADRAATGVIAALRRRAVTSAAPASAVSTEPGDPAAPSIRRTKKQAKRARVAQQPQQALHSGYESDAEAESEEKVDEEKVDEDFADDFGGNQLSISDDDSRHNEEEEEKEGAAAASAARVDSDEMTDDSEVEEEEEEERSAHVKKLHTELVDSDEELSDSEDESTTYNTNYGITKFQHGKKKRTLLSPTLVMNRSKLHGFRTDHFVKQAKLEQAKRKLLPDARAIHDLMPEGRSRGATTVVCAILKQTDGRAYRRFVFTNKRGRPSAKILAGAHSRGYQVVSGAQAHAEGQMIQYLESRKGVYQLVFMACDKDHCAECHAAMKSYLGDDYLTKSKNQTDGKLYKQWKNPPALYEALGRKTAATAFRDAHGNRPGVKAKANRALATSKKKAVAGAKKRKRVNSDSD